MTAALMGAWVQAIRRWRVDRLALAALAVTLTLTAGLAAAVPRIATRTADAALRADASAASESARTVLIASSGQQPYADESGFLDTQLARAAELLARAPAPVRALTQEPTITMDARRYIIAPDAGRPRAGAFFTIRTQPRLEDQLRLVDGRFPTSAHFGKAGKDRPPLIVEIGVAVSTAETLDIGVGDHFNLNPDPNAGPNVPDAGVDVVVEVTGVFEPRDRASAYWRYAGQLLSPSTFDMGESQTIFATVAAGPDALVAIARTSAAITTTAIYPLNTDGLVSSDAPRLAQAFGELPIAYRDAGVGTLDSITARSGFGTVLERYIEAEGATARVLSIALASLAGVALLTIVLLAILLAVRRRPAALLHRQRGASWLQLVAPAASEAALIAIGSASAGYLLTRVLLPGSQEAPSVAAAAGVGIAALVALVGARIGSLAGDQRAGRVGGLRPARRRLVGELFVVLLAALGIYLLRSRGLASSAGTGVDPFLAAVPLLAALGMGLIVLRLYPHPLRVAASLAGRGRGLTATFGLRRAADAESQRLPLVALLLATALGVFGVTLATSIGSGQASAALEQVGADYRVDAVTGPNPSRLGVAEIPGMEATAAAWIVSDAPIITSSRRGGSDARLVAIDVAGFEQVRGETLPQPLHEAPDPDAPLPAVISSNLGPGEPINQGDTFSVSIAGSRIEMLAIEVRSTFAAIGPGERFVVTSLDAMEARLDRTVAPSQLLVRGDPGLGPAIRDRAIELGAVSVVTARDETLAKVREAPFSVAVVDGYALTLLIAAGYVVVAVVIGLLLGREARERDLVHLRTMGLGRRDTVALVAVEQLPMPVIGVLAGTLLGLLLVALVGPGLDLAAFIGSEQPVPLTVPWALLAALAAAFGALMLLITLVASLTARAVDPARALRVGDT